MRKRPTVLIGFLAVAVAAVVILPMGIQSHRAKIRKQWKNEAITRIAGRIDDSGWLQGELNKLGPGRSEHDAHAGNWLSPHLILFKNGEWLTHANVCRKQDWRIDDIFIGRASNDRWYFSTFHFCKDMVVLRMEEQPESLNGFVNAYFLREFDRDSDECLEKTWPVR